MYLSKAYFLVRMVPQAGVLLS